jgi:hypothetical protein
MCMFSFRHTFRSVRIALTVAASAALLIALNGHAQANKTCISKATEALPSFCLDEFFSHLPLRKTASLNPSSLPNVPAFISKTNKAAKRRIMARRAGDGCWPNWSQISGLTLGKGPRARRS